MRDEKSIYTYIYKIYKFHLFIIFKTHEFELISPILVYHPGILCSFSFLSAEYPSHESEDPLPSPQCLLIY